MGIEMPHKADIWKIHILHVEDPLRTLVKQIHPIQHYEWVTISLQHLQEGKRSVEVASLK